MKFLFIILISSVFGLSKPNGISYSLGGHSLEIFPDTIPHIYSKRMENGDSIHLLIKEAKGKAHAKLYDSNNILMMEGNYENALVESGNYTSIMNIDNNKKTLMIEKFWVPYETGAWYLPDTFSKWNYKLFLYDTIIYK